ncbi:MAG: hypothetical protein F4Y16_17215, partial [Holophagales bacterium]|nr:hypothetical protein [Holophagales bacterium]
MTFEAEGASESDLRGELELRIDEESVEIEGVTRADGDWQTLVYVDMALTTPGPVFQLAEVLLEQLDPLLEAGSLEIVVADPQARTILPPTRDRDLAEAALNRLATGEEAASALVDRRRLFTSERDLEFSRARQQAAAGSRDRLTELEVVLEQMARDAIREETAMRRSQIDEIVSFLAAREDLRRDAPGATQSTRRHLIVLADGLVADPLSFYLELVPTAGSLAVEAATIPDLGGVARTAASFGWTAAPVAFAASENGDGVRVRSNEVTVGFTLRFNRPRSGASQTVEEELGLFVRPSGWEVAADATGGDVLLNKVAIADWIERLPRRFEASFELPGNAAAAGAFDLSDGAGERGIDAPIVTPGAGSPDDVAEVRLRRAFEGELDSEFEGGDAGVEVVASIRIESASPERIVGRLTSTIVPPAGSPPADGSMWRVSTRRHPEDGPGVTRHAGPFAAP